MSEIKSFQNKKNEKTINKLKDVYAELTGYDEKYELATKRNSKLYRLAEKIFSMKMGEHIDFNIEDEIGSIIVCGACKGFDFECEYIFISSYGGGHENVVGINEFIGVDDINEWLEKVFENCKIQ